ncbi:MAG: ATP-binding protein, partial [Myxococcota bacterium]
VPSEPPPGDTRCVAVLEDGRGQLLVGRGSSVCRAPVDRVLAGPIAGWTRDALAPGRLLLDVERTSTGAFWAAVADLGVLRWSGEDRAPWTPIPASLALRVGTLGQLTPSPRGGIWVVAEGDVVRVEDDPTAPSGWRVLERLAGAQGLPAPAAPLDLDETPAGDVWVVLQGGEVLHVPAAVRETVTDPPPVYVIGVRTDGEAHDPDDPLVVPYERNNVELLFAAPNSDRGRLRYRYRLDAGAPWAPLSSDATLRLAALAAGVYRVEVEASIDGLAWSPRPARVEVRVQRPWFLRPAFLIGLGAAALGVGLVAHRIRMRVLVRLEAQRTRIARDLHDEIGSGLGSIGLLVGVALHAGGREDTLRRIGALASELGTSLTDIVTALRPGACTLTALHRHLVERGLAACPTGVPRFEAEGSERIPAIPLSLGVRIHVLLIAVEAIHNAVRHAGARTVTVRLEPGGGTTWVLTVADDGVGTLPERPAGVRGMGLHNMRTRAAGIGASIRWSAVPGRGTTVRLAFEPTADVAERGD